MLSFMKVEIIERNDKIVKNEMKQKNVLPLVWHCLDCHNRPTDRHDTHTVLVELSTKQMSIHYPGTHISEQKQSFSTTVILRTIFLNGKTYFNIATRYV